MLKGLLEGIYCTKKDNRIKQIKGKEIHNLQGQCKKNVNVNKDLVDGSDLHKEPLSGFTFFNEHTQSVNYFTFEK